MRPKRLLLRHVVRVHLGDTHNTGRTFTRYGEGMSLKSDVARIQSDATRSESERIWAAIALIAARFDSKSIKIVRFVSYKFTTMTESGFEQR